MSQRYEHKCLEKSAAGNVYLDRQAATKAAHSQRDRYGVHVRAYRCPCCQRFHVGSISLFGHHCNSDAQHGRRFVIRHADGTVVAAYNSRREAESELIHLNGLRGNDFGLFDRGEQRHLSTPRTLGHLITEALLKKSPTRK